MHHGGIVAAAVWSGLAYTFLDVEDQDERVGHRACVVVRRKKKVARGDEHGVYLAAVLDIKRVSVYIDVRLA